MKPWYHLGYCVTHSHCVTKYHRVSLCSFLCAGGLRAMGPKCAREHAKGSAGRGGQYDAPQSHKVPSNTQNQPPWGQHCFRYKVASLPILSRVQVVPQFNAILVKVSALHGGGGGAEYVGGLQGLSCLGAGGLSGPHHHYQGLPGTHQGLSTRLGSKQGHICLPSTQSHSPIPFVLIFASIQSIFSRLLQNRYC